MTAAVVSPTFAFGDQPWIRALVDPDASTRWRKEPPGSPIPFVASTSDRARDGLELRTSGWRTKRYESNGVLLWCHRQQDPPVGRAEVSRARALQGLAWFDQEDEFALKIERKYRSGVMNGFSVGWDFVDGDGRPINWRRQKPDYLRDRAFYELNEISAVPVPADANALTARARSGMLSLSRDLERVLRDGGDLESASDNLRRALDGFPRQDVIDAGAVLADIIARAIAARGRGTHE